MTLDKDLATLALQEQRLQFDRFDATTAWALGSRLKALAETRGVAVTIEVRIARETVFLYAMPGTAPTNADWARRKRNTVELLQRSSYATGLSLKQGGGSLETSMGLALRDYASHGGAFPIVVKGCGCIGVVTVSGLPQREDHAMVCEVLAGMCGVPAVEIALD